MSESTPEIVRRLNRETVVRQVLTGRLAAGVSEYNLARVVVAYLDAWEEIPAEDIEERLRQLSEGPESTQATRAGASSPQSPPRAGPGRSGLR